MVKVISLSEEAYRKLKMLKGIRSFSEVVVDMADKEIKKNTKIDLSEFCGIWKGEEGDRIVEELKGSRKNAKLREVDW